MFNYKKYLQWIQHWTSPDTSAVQLWTRLTRAASSWGETMKQTSPSRMREIPDIREREGREETVETIRPDILLISDQGMAMRDLSELTRTR